MRRTPLKGKYLMLNIKIKDKYRLGKSKSWPPRPEVPKLRVSGIKNKIRIANAL